VQKSYIGDIEGIAGARTNIAAAKSQLEGGCSNSRRLGEVYELQVAKSMKQQFVQVNCMLLTYGAPTAGLRQGKI